MAKSYAQRHARLPTVVGWAGWRCVNPRQGSVAMLLGKLGQRVDHRRDPAAIILSPSRSKQQVGVVGHVAARRPQVNNRPGVGTHVAVGVNVGHHVVPQLLLVLSGRREIDVVDVGLQLVDLRLA